MQELNSIQQKLKDTVSKYLEIIKFEVVETLFEPTCVVRIDPGKQKDEIYDLMDKEIKPMGFKTQFTAIGKNERKFSEEFKDLDQGMLLYTLSFIPRRITSREIDKGRKERIATTSLFFITLVTVYLAALFYFTLIDPVFAYQNNNLSQNILNTVYFMAGCIIIIFAHEMGHKIASDVHKIPATMPYLIPGPPPLGMLGAYVKIKDSMSTRNKTFDIALSGILFGIVASIILVIIGFFMSEVVSTSDYVDLRMDMLNAIEWADPEVNDQYEFIAENLNPYNFLMQFIQGLMYPEPSYSLYGPSYDQIYLPDTLIIMHPIGFAGWVGLYISVVNLLPLPILDGGHVFRSLFAQKWAPILGAVIGLGLCFLFDEYLYYFGFIGMSSVCARLNKRPSDPQDITLPFVPLTKSRKIVAILVLVMVIFLFPHSIPTRLFGISA
ncbi:MAG: site-2 protease family protein [Candidatus Hodarchaeota archaeon]